MTDDFVDRRADTLWVPVVSERTGITVSLDGLLEYNLVDLIRCDAWSNFGGGDLEDLSCELVTRLLSVVRNAHSPNIPLRPSVRLPALPTC